MLASGADAGLWQIEAGLAWHCSRGIASSTRVSKMRGTFPLRGIPSAPVALLRPNEAPGYAGVTLADFEVLADGGRESCHANSWARSYTDKGNIQCAMERAWRDYLLAEAVALLSIGVGGGEAPRVPTGRAHGNGCGIRLPLLG